MKAEELLQNVINAWNAQADEYNQWHELDADERVEFAMRTIREAEQQALRKSLDKAANACDGIAERFRQENSRKWPELRQDAEDGAEECAEAIRALIEREET